jgi:hypothetical protein
MKIFEIVGSNFFLAVAGTIGLICILFWRSMIFKIAAWYLVILSVFAAYTGWLPQIRGDAPADAVAIDLDAATPEKLAEMGKMIIFGTNDPEGMLAGGGNPAGKGQCPLCHQFFLDQKADRCPNLVALPSAPDERLRVPEEVRSHNRFKEERYKAFQARLANGEPNSGVKPHANAGGEYLIESEYCPNCYVVEGFAVKGTNDSESPMPIINKPPIQLADTEIVSVVSFLQSKDTPGDFSRVTAKESWESYFGKKLEAVPAPGAAQVAADAPKIAMETDTPEEIVQKMGCFACHKIPGISVAKIGMIGPLLIEGVNAPNRIKSKEYKAAIKAGTANARTPKEYVMESIMKPAAFIVPGFQDDMLKDFSHKFTFAALEKMAEYLLQQDEAAAIRDGLDRLPNELEGPLKPPGGTASLSPVPPKQAALTKAGVKGG